MNRSKGLFEQARRLCPGGVHSNARYLEPYPLYFSKAKGCYIWDVDGKKYMDFHVSHGAVALGHGDDEVTREVAQVLENGLLCGIETELAIDVTQRLVAIVPGAEMARFCCGGTDAVMKAVQIARGYTKREKIVKMEGAFHGGYDYVDVNFRAPIKEITVAGKTVPCHYESAGATTDVRNKTVVVQFNDIEALKEVFHQYPDQIACVIIEPIMFNSGAIFPQKGYLNSIRKLTQDFGSLLIFDEVITGFRPAPGGAQEYYGVEPDLSTFGKALANGYPLAAVTGKRNVMEITTPKTGKVGFGGTYNANQVSLAAAHSCLKRYVSGEVQKYLNSITVELKKGFDQICREFGIEARVEGLGGQFTIYFTTKEVNNYREARATDSGTGRKFLELQPSLQKRGFRLLPKHIYHHGLSAAHSKNDIGNFLEAVRDSFREILINNKREAF
jgi:glutamate-1-semialdehyde 2,1-aminomutase